MKGISEEVRKKSKKKREKLIKKQKKFIDDMDEKQKKKFYLNSRFVFTREILRQMWANRRRKMFNPNISHWAWFPSYRQFCNKIKIAKGGGFIVK